MGALRQAYMARAMGQAGSRLTTDVGNIYAQRQEVKEKERKSQAVEALMEAVRILKGQTTEVEGSDLQETQTRGDIYGGENFSEMFKLDGKGVGGKAEIQAEATPEEKAKAIMSSAIYKELYGNKGAMGSALAGYEAQAKEKKTAKALTAKQKREDEQAEIAHKRALALAKLKSTGRETLEEKKTKGRKDIAKIGKSTAKAKNLSALYLKMSNTYDKKIAEWIYNEGSVSDIAIERLALYEMEKERILPEVATARARKKAKARSKEYLEIVDYLEKLNAGEVKKEDEPGFLGKAYYATIKGIKKLIPDKKTKKTSGKKKFTLMK